MIERPPMFAKVKEPGEFCQLCKEATPKRKHLMVVIEGGWQICGICDVAPRKP